MGVPAKTPMSHGATDPREGGVRPLAVAPQRNFGLWRRAPLPEPNFRLGQKATLPEPNHFIFKLGLPRFQLSRPSGMLGSGAKHLRPSLADWARAGAPSARA